MKRILQLRWVALSAAACVAAGALAQEPEDVTVQASRVEAKQIGYTSSGLPVKDLAVTHWVAYTDLDLNTETGMAELESRVQKAASHGCREIDMAYNGAQPNDRVCARLATREAMARIRERTARD